MNLPPNFISFNCIVRNDHLFNGIPHFVLTREKNNVETKFPIASERLLQVIKEQIKCSSDTVYFFTDASGKHVTSNKVDHWLEKTAAKAGVMDITCNDFRRTFCSRLYWMGCHPVFVEYLMEHTVNGIHARYLVHNLSEIYRELLRIEEEKKQKVWHTVGIHFQ
jgi:integrase